MKIQYSLNQLENEETYQSFVNGSIIDFYKEYDLSQDTLSFLSTLLHNKHLIYRWCDYHYLPIILEENDKLKYIFIMASKFCNYFNNYIYILKHIENDLTIKGLKSTKTIIDSGSHNIDKNYNNTINTNGEDKGVTENAPITADIDTINTPNFKNKNVNSKNSTRTGKDTDTHTTSNNMEETNPELFNKYMELYKEYNIIEVIDKCYRRIIAEFNSSL